MKQQLTNGKNPLTGLVPVMYRKKTRDNPTYLPLTSVEIKSKTETASFGLYGWHSPIRGV